MTADKALVNAEIESRQKLILEATRLFADQGYDGTSVRDIADAAQLNISLVSYYFGGKEGLYREILKSHAKVAEDNIAMLVAAAQPSKMTRESFLAGISVIVDQVAKSHAENPFLMKILEHEMNKDMPHSRDLFESTFHKALETVSNIIEEAQKKGIARKDVRPKSFFLMFVFLIEKFFQLSRCSTNLSKMAYQLPEEIDVLKQEVIGILLNGGLKK